MPADPQDLSQIRHVQPADPVAAPVTSQPTRALELRINNLYALFQQLTAATAAGQLIIYNVAIQTAGAAAPALNSFVFFNANTGVYERAIATVTAVTAGFVSNPTAFGLGVVIAVRGALADIMVGGYASWTEATQQAMMEGVEVYQPGVPYFLSALEAGKLTRFAPTLRVQILIGTDQHFILAPSWASPEAIENIYAVGVGMRPVGSTRSLAPDYEHQIIVGFDALEKYSDPQAAWRSTRDSTIVELNQFGYLLADATVTAVPASPVYIGMEIATNGVVAVYSAGTLADLYVGGPLLYNVSAPLALSDSNKDTVRGYAVYDTANNPIGTLNFRFVSADRSWPRRLVFKFPDDFQGWKMVHAPVAPQATAIVAGGQITGFNLAEQSVGYDTAPIVVITDPTGTGAAALAILDDWGTIASLQVTAPGANYTSPTVRFDNQVSGVNVLNGGAGALATASVTAGAISSVNLTAGGTGYLSNPDVVILDATGSGADAVVLAIARNGQVVELKISNAGHDYANPVLFLVPARNQDYQLTTPGVFTAGVVGGAITSALVADGGFNYPANAAVRFNGIGTGAAASLEVDANGTVTGIAVTNPGSGYDDTTTVTVAEKTPRLLLAGGNPDTLATGHVTLAAMGVGRIEITSEGIAYSSLVTITPSGGLGAGGVAAQFKPVIDGSGRLQRVDVIDPGSGYIYAPTLVLASAGDGNGFVAQAILGAPVISATLDTAGANYQSAPTAAVGVPLDSLELQSGGTAYTDAPAVTIDPPDDPAGTQATGVAILGAGIATVLITDPGTGYTDPANVTISVTGGGGTGAVLLPIFAGGQLVDVVVLEPGSNYSSAPALTVNAVTGAGATCTANIDGIGSVIGFQLTCPGSGYTQPPGITVEFSSGITARARAQLVGGTAALMVAMAGAGGVRRSGAVSAGNALQLSTFHEDLDDGDIIFPAPLDTAFYYNIKADPALLGRYPAVPIAKAAFILNGVELVTSAFDEAQLSAADPAADVILARKTVFWPSLDADGSPWDREQINYIQDPGAAGRDNVIPQTGFADDADNWWRLWANTFIYESGRNRAWMHINRASRFSASGKVVSLGVLSPLKAVDVVSGVAARSDGSPLSGQLLLTVDSQTSLLADPSAQMDFTTLGNLTAIYTNTTGRQVLLSSILLNVTFQLNATGQSATAQNCAQLTVGTQEGNYADIIGAVDGPAPVRLYAVNQAKELFPEADSAAPLLAPNQKVYIRVVAPAGSPINKQLVVARVKGHVL